MKRSVYNIIEEPVGDMYRDLVTFCSKHATTMLLVVREPQMLANTALITISALAKIGASGAESSEWPGTQLTRGGTACVYRIPVTRDSIDLVANTATSLYAWQSPALPEDLCFLRGDGEDILASISHEEDAYLTLSDDEYTDFLKAPNLRLLNIQKVEE